MIDPMVAAHTRLKIGLAATSAGMVVALIALATVLARRTSEPASPSAPGARAFAPVMYSTEVEKDLLGLEAACTQGAGEKCAEAGKMFMTSGLGNPRFIDGVRASEPERVGGDRKALARLGSEAILKMIFIDGFVHADLHPGNILLTSGNEVFLIDLGLMAEVPTDLMKPWIETFAALARQDGKTVARMLYGYSPSVMVRDYARFERDVVSGTGTRDGTQTGREPHEHLAEPQPAEFERLAHGEAV